MSKNKKAKRELAIKKAKQKRIVMITAAAVVVAALAVAIIIGAVSSAGTETYTNGSATITLRPNGRFSATLHHNERFSGTYVKTEGGVELSHDGVTITAVIDGDRMHIPDEWDDGHGHGSYLTRR